MMEKLREALEQPVGVDEGSGFAEMPADDLWVIFEAACRVLDAPQIWWCVIHDSRVEREYRSNVCQRSNRYSMPCRMVRARLITEEME